MEIMTNLKEINFGINQYCGPAVLSALTGKSTDECAAVISSINGKAIIKAISTDELLKALEKLRFKVEDQKFYGQTLYAALVSISKNEGMYVVMIPKHLVAVEVKDNQIFLVDNHSKQPLPAQSSARLMQRVDKIWKVISKEPPRFIRSEILLEKSSYGANFRLDIITHNIYADSKDDTRYRLGQILYKDNLELSWIIEALQKGYPNEQPQKHN